MHVFVYARTECLDFEDLANKVLVFKETETSDVLIVEVKELLKYCAYCKLAQIICSWIHFEKQILKYSFLSVSAQFVIFLSYKT